MTTSRWGRRVPFQDVVDVAGVKVAFSGDLASLGWSQAIPRKSLIIIKGQK
jgi:hypothetical protein